MHGHRYSEAGLQGYASLKGRDQAVASVLQRVSSHGKLDVHLAFIERQLTGERCDELDDGTIEMPDDPAVRMHAYALQCLDSANRLLPPLRVAPEEIVQVCLS